jgi:hypothetical protein
MLLHTTVCLGDPRWEVRRMAGQLLPAITELLCWFSMGRLRELWQTLLRPDLLGKLRPGAAPAVSCELLAFAAGLSLRHALRKAEVSLGLPYCGTHLGKSLYKDTLNLVMQHRCRHPGRKVALHHHSTPDSPPHPVPRFLKRRRGRTRQVFRALLPSLGAPADAAARARVATLVGGVGDLVAPLAPRLQQLTLAAEARRPAAPSCIYPQWHQSLPFFYKNPRGACFHELLIGSMDSSETLEKCDLV